MARRPDETDGGNAVDRVVQRAAVGLSRRSFLGKLGKLGLGAGLGLVGANVASANCGNCDNCGDSCGPCTDGARTCYRVCRDYCDRQCSSRKYYKSCTGPTAVGT